MAIITIGTPFNIDLEFKIAPFSKRLLAWLTDVIMICLYYYVMLRFIYPLVGISEALNTVASYLLVVIPVMLYQVTFEILFHGQTVGKMAAGIKVIDRDGQEATWGQYIVRWMLCIGNLFVFIIPYIILRQFGLMIFLMVLYLPDVITILVSAKSQRIGDFAAGTVVIDKSYRANINETIYLDVASDNYKPVFPQVMRLSDRDINGIRNLLKTAQAGRETDRYTIDVSLKIKAFLGIESDLHPLDLLIQLLKDYNYFTSLKG